MTATASESVNRHFGYDQHSKNFYAMLLLLLRRNSTNLILLSSLFSFVLLKQFNKQTLNETIDLFSTWLFSLRRTIDNKVHIQEISTNCKTILYSISTL